MASKNKKRDERPGAKVGGSLRLETERLIAKDRLKDAVKQAKLCYKEEATPENHRLLERAYLLRADQLRRNAMPTAAQEVAHHLLDFGVTTPELVEDAARLLIALGMTRQALALQGRLDSPEAKERLARDEADQAVLHPERNAAASAEIRKGAAVVREALEALQAGDEAKATAILRDLARSSPFSDWKLFGRGLAAFYRREEPEARNNWDRLDPQRAASKIARALVSLSPQEPKDAVKLEALEKRIFGEPILEPLEQLRALVVQERWEDAVRRIATLRLRLQRVDPKLSIRLTRVLYGPLVRSLSEFDYREAKALVKEFSRVAEPLPIDPRWNRFWAMVWEGPQGSLEDSEEYWRKYMKDLESLPILSPDERTLAQGLILKHIGEEILHNADMLDLPASPFESPVSKREVSQERKLAVGALEESLRLAPRHRDTYRTLLEAYKKWGQRDQAVAVARRLVDAFPDDYETILYLAMYHFERNEPVKAVEYAARARAVKPLDPSTAEIEWSSRVSLARHLALEKRFDEGRAEFAAAERASPGMSQSFFFKARRAALELKAGHAERGNALIVEAQESLVEPTPLWLALRIEATRFALPKVDQERFEALWTQAVTRKCRSETAGALADLMAGFVSGVIDYPGRVAHLKQVADYLRRTTRIKYRMEDLVRVCRFLLPMPRERVLFDKMLKKGLKLFPESPVFLMMAGGIEMEKGPFKGGNIRLARTYFEKALKLVEASKDPEEARLLPKLRESLSMLKDLMDGPMGLPFRGFGGGMPSMKAMIDMMGFFDDDDFDDDDDDDDRPPAPPRRKSPGGRAKKG